MSEIQKYLITPAEVRSIRQISQYVEDKKVETYISESENLDIKPNFGDALFIDIKDHPENYDTLLNGGIYETTCGDKKSFSGLKTALNYYAYARLMKNGDYNVTRFGVVNKQGEWSNPSDYKEKVTAYNDAFSVADSYLKECVVYLNDNKEKFKLYKGKGGVKANRTIYKILGD